MTDLNFFCVLLKILDTSVIKLTPTISGQFYIGATVNFCEKFFFLCLLSEWLTSLDVWFFIPFPVGLKVSLIMNTKKYMKL